MIFHVISLIILSKNILLNLLIAFTYYLISIDIYSWYIKLYLSIIGN